MSNIYNEAPDIEIGKHIKIEGTAVEDPNAITVIVKADEEQSFTESRYKKLNSIDKIKVFAVDADNNIVSKFCVKSTVKSPVASMLYRNAIKLFEVVEDRKKKKENEA